MRSPALYFRLRLFSLVCFLFCHYGSTAQLTVEGPTCVTAGATYQYIIKGNWDSIATAQVCFSGGIIEDSAGSCKQGVSFSVVRVVWSHTSNANVSFTYNGYDTVVNVNVTAPLDGGQIDSLSTIQTIEFETAPAGILCSSSFGGDCNPNYVYQWQESLDNVSWQDMNGSQGQHLTNQPVLTQTKFFRRKVIETLSQTVQFSTVAAVYVNPPIR